MWELLVHGRRMQTLTFRVCVSKSELWCPSSFSGFRVKRDAGREKYRFNANNLWLAFLCCFPLNFNPVPLPCHYPVCCLLVYRRPCYYTYTPSFVSFQPAVLEGNNPNEKHPIQPHHPHPSPPTGN